MPGMKFDGEEHVTLHAGCSAFKQQKKGVAEIYYGREKI